MYTTWKWSNGEAYYKSARPERSTSRPERNVGETLDYDSQKNAIQQSLADFNCDNDLINITNSMFSRNQNQSGTKREDLDSKIAGREMLAQRGVNPFMQTSYVNDVVARDMFLKPINTTFEKPKEKTDS